MPKVSICVPTHDMENGEFFLERLTDSLDKQTFRDFELIITKEGKMARNTNAAIKKARGEIIKILYMDDFLYDKNALQHLVDGFSGGWAASGCVHDNGANISNPHFPKWNDEVKNGNNTIGSPSVVAFANDTPLLFDENLSWLLDCELYGRLYARYGEPTIINYLDIGIGIGDHQTTHTMSDIQKQAEFTYIMEKYGTTH